MLISRRTAVGGLRYVLSVQLRGVSVSTCCTPLDGEWGRAEAVHGVLSGAAVPMAKKQRLVRDQDREAWETMSLGALVVEEGKLGIREVG